MMLKPKRYVTLLAMLLVCLQFMSQAQNPAPAAKPKPGVESCDGALDIVPGKSATFMRKRRSAAKKPAPKVETKPEGKVSR